MTRLKGAGGAKGEKLVAAGIFTVADMKGKSDDELLKLSAALAGISLARLMEWRDHTSHLRACYHIASAASKQVTTKFHTA